ncbi:MAG: hypothetical protein ACK4Z4_04335 [Ferrovibrio sp.]|nr:hypothetical protein [Alphaproteobacteria bacterium]
MTARSQQAELERHRAELRHETLQQRQQAAVDAAREAEDLRAIEAQKVVDLRNMRLARDARRAAAKVAAGPA